ncbi:hypothetical protein JT359_05025 [Candidatus Poribacteria bacterium]|nr:hypothetical protein [Candidatus Poribacteria bacterium]
MKRIKTSNDKSIYYLIALFCITTITFSASAEWAIVQETDPDIRDYMSITFTDGKTGWVAGAAVLDDFENPGFIGYTFNGGKSWQKSEIKIPAELTGIYFLDADHGWAIGQKGMIANTTNGKDWDIQISKVDTTLRSIYFVNKDVGYAVGENETILSSKNGGRTWKVLYGGIVGNVGDDETSMFNAIQFLDESTGWIAGIRVFPAKKQQKTIIQKTTDGAQTWTQQETGKEDIIEDIFFIDDSTGWAVGENGIILYTNNGGKKWSEQTSGTEETIRSVAFADNNVGWAVGGDFGVGVILSTTDGGESWTVETQKQKMVKVHVLDRKNAWLAGSSGLILKSE